MNEYPHLLAGGELIDELGRAPQKRDWFQYTLDFNTTIAAGAAGVAQRQINFGGHFVLQRIQGTFFIVAASGSAVAYAPAAIDADPLQANNTWMFYSNFLVQLRTSAGLWSSSPVRADLLCGTANRPNYLLTPRLLRAGEEVFAELTNNSDEAIQGQIVLDGYRLT